MVEWLESILNWIKILPDHFEVILKQAIVWLVGSLISIGMTVLQPLLANLPEGEVDLGPLVTVAGLINTWIPLDLAVSLYAAYLAFLATFYTIKMTLKLIPTIG